MIDSVIMEKLMKDSEFPLVQGIYVESSNVNGNTVSASAVTNVNKVSERMRLDALKNLCVDISESSKTIKGFSLACTERWTVADDIVKKYKTFDANDKFEVIWLQDTVMEREYHGYAGYEIHRLTGIVLHYPEELANVA